MKYKNTGKRILCLLLVVCSILTSINYNRIETRAKIDEKKLYMDYLAKEKKRLQKVLKENKDENLAVMQQYKIIDLDYNGKKALLYSFWAGGNRPTGMMCTVQDGEICCKECEMCGEFYRVKGSKSKIAVHGIDGGMRYYYKLYTIKDSNLKKKAEYECNTHGYDGTTITRYYKNNKAISENSFKRFEKNLKQIKLKDYKG